MSDEEALRLNIGNSLKAASEALRQMEVSLEKGHFFDALPSYEKMAEVLLAQRMWLGQSVDAATATAFDELSRRAARIQGILEQYAGVMLRIRTLGPAAEEPHALQATDAGEPTSLTLAERAVTQLKGRGPVPFTRLQSELNVGRRELEAAIQELERANAVHTLLQGGRRMVMRTSLPPTDHG